MADDPTMLTGLASAEVVEYLRVGPDDVPDLTTIQGLMAASEIYLMNAGCQLNKDDALAKLAEKILTSHWYENREPVGVANKLAFGLDGIILQLQLANPTNVNPNPPDTTQTDPEMFTDIGDLEGGGSFEPGGTS